MKQIYQLRKISFRNILLFQDKKYATDFQRLSDLEFKNKSKQ